MKETGVCLIILALVLLFVSFIFDVSVEVTRPYVPSLSPYLPPMPGSTENVVNLQKLQMQMMFFQGGLVSFLGGMVAYAGGAILEALPKQEPRRDPSDDQPQASSAAPATEPTDAQAVPAFYVDGDSEEMSAGKVIGVIILVILVTLGLVVAIVSLTGGARSTANSHATEAGNDMMMDANAMDMGMDASLQDAPYPELK